MVSSYDGNTTMGKGLHAIHNKQYFEIHLRIAIKKCPNNATN